jgi:hypothetical protein
LEGIPLAVALLQTLVAPDSPMEALRGRGTEQTFIVVGAAPTRPAPVVRCPWCAVSDVSEVIHIASMAPGPARGEVGRIPSAGDRQRESIARWGVALERHDADEVARLVRQSHDARNEDAATGRFGPMVGTVGPTTANGVVE